MGKKHFPRIIEWFGLERTLKTIHFHHLPSMGRDTFHQPRVLQALSNLALNLAREEEATASLGNLSQGLTTLRVKNFLLTSNLNVPSLSLKLLPLVLSVYTLVKSPSLDLL